MTAPLDLRRGELSFDVVRPLLGARLDGGLTGLVQHGFNYSDPAGSAALREAFTSTLAKIATDPQNTLVTHGALGAIDLAVRAFQPRRFVAFDPTYREALSIAAAHGVPAEALPAILTTAEDVAARLRPDDLVYVVPALNNPDGRCLDETERESLGRAIALSGAALVEDDAYGLLMPEPAAAPSVAARALAADPAAQVLRLQSFSKVVCPGARCCVVEGSPDAMKRISMLKVDFGTSPLAAEFVHSVLVDGFEQFRAAVAQELRTRCALARAALGPWPGGSTPDDGYFLWLPWHTSGREPGGTADSTAVVAEIARAAGVLVADGRAFQIGAAGGTAHLRISVAWASHDELVAGCSALRQHRSRH